MLKESAMWYSSWFDTPYYHILYKDRDQSEAQEFMDNLTSYLSLEPKEKILDLACGKGRHSIYLNKIGYNVTGVDLSQNSINYAKQFQNEMLKFETHNMCESYPDTFSAVFNLFTSFGYFEKEEENLKTIKAIKSNLNEKGLGVIDFMNVNYVSENLIPKETKIMDDISFDIKRYITDNHIYKDIKFTDNKTDYFFTEKVRALTLDDFKSLFSQAEINLLDVFGTYQLEPFDLEKSPRLILIFK